MEDGHQQGYSSEIAYHFALPSRLRIENFQILAVVHGLVVQAEIVRNGLARVRAVEAVEFFENLPHLQSKLKMLQDVGLGYIKIGQPCTTLSGGESQRIKLATELSKKDTGSTLYILDEPTTGLHFEDINILLGVLQKLVDKGNTVIVIEHNLDVIKVADYLIDMGPGGGKMGGSVVCTGTPEEVAQNKKSVTAPFLREELGMK